MNQHQAPKDSVTMPSAKREAFDYLKASGTMDMTGAMPTPPQSDAELESYLDTYNFLPQSSLTKGHEKAKPMQ